MTNLTHQQVRELQLELDKIDLHCDITSNAPAEIRDSILQYIPLRQVFRLRRVSRKWYSILSAPETVDNALRTWYPEHEARGTTVPSVLETLSPEVRASIRAEHVDAFQTGRPFGVADHDFEENSRNVMYDFVAYSSGLVVWLERSSRRTASVLDLRTGRKRCIMTENRGSMDQIVISNLMIAAIGTSGGFYVWNILTEEHFSIRLPSARMREIVIMGSTLAILGPPVSTTDGRKFEGVTWNLKSQTSQSFIFNVGIHLGEENHNPSRRLMIDAEEKSLLWVERLHEDFKDIYLYKRVAFDGNTLAEGSIEYSYQHYDDDPYGLWRSTDHNANLWVFFTCNDQVTIAEHLRGQDSKMHQIYYDFELNKLVIREAKIAYLSPESLCDCRLLFRKNIAYRYDCNSAEFGIIDFHSTPGKCSLTTSESWWPQSWRDGRRPLDWGRAPIFFGDEDFLVIVTQGNLIAWRFSDVIETNGTALTYEETRSSILQNIRRGQRESSAKDPGKSRTLVLS